MKFDSTVQKKFSHKLWELYPTGLIPRSQIGSATSGLLSPKSMANKASQGNFPAGTVKICGKVAYDVDELVEWLFNNELQGGQ